MSCQLDHTLCHLAALLAIAKIVKRTKSEPLALHIPADGMHQPRSENDIQHWSQPTDVLRASILHTIAANVGTSCPRRRLFQEYGRLSQAQAQQCPAKPAKKPKTVAGSLPTIDVTADSQSAEGPYDLISYA